MLKKNSAWLRVLSGGHDPQSTQGRQQIGIWEGWVSTAVSIGLASIKIWYGVMSGSMALTADAVNNATDAVTSVLVALSYHWSRKPRDARHPFGHGRMECIAAVIVSILLVVVGIEVAQSGIQRLLAPVSLVITNVVLGVVAGTLLIKAVLALFVFRLAQATGADALRADAWNHSFDILCTATVLLGLWGSRLGWVALDAWSAVLVSVFIIYTGARFVLQTVSKLLGEAPSKSEVEEIESIGYSYPSVQDVHDIMIHRYGDLRVVSFHIEMEVDRDALAMHDEAEQIEHQIEEVLACKAIVHVDPVDRSHPYYEPLRKQIERLTKEEPAIRSFHDLRVLEEQGHLMIRLDVVATLDASEAEHRRLRQWMTEKISDMVDENADISVRVEALHDGQE